MPEAFFTVAVTVYAVEQLPKFLRTAHGMIVEHQDHVPRTNAGALGGTGLHFLDDHTALVETEMVALLSI